MGTKPQPLAPSFALYDKRKATPAELFFVLALAFSFSPSALSSNDEEFKSSVTLNNEGVTALKSSDYDTAMSKLQLALKITPGYKLAKENLAITYNNAGIACSKDTAKCLKDFHMAAWLNPGNITTAQNIDASIKAMKKNPLSFEDRVALAEACENDNDFAGAIVEYQAAMKIKNAPELKKKIEAVKMPDEWKKIQSAPPAVAAKPKSDVDFGPYMADLQRRIKKNWHPPADNASRQARVFFKVHKDGTLSDLKIDKTSGITAVDFAALEAARMASPVRPLPEGAPDPVDIQFTYDYNVNKTSKPEDQEKTLKERIATLEKRGATNELATALRELGANEAEQEKNEEAIGTYTRALKLLEAKKSNKKLQADIDEDLADLYYGQNQFSEALPIHRKGLDLFLLDSKRSPNELAKAYNSLGFTLLHVDDDHTDEALREFEKGRENAEKADDAEHIIDSTDGMAYCYFKQGLYKKARSLYEKVVSDTEKVEGDKSPNMMRRAKSVADCDYELGKLKEALTNYKHAVSFSSTADSDDSDELDEANQRIDELASRLNLPGREDAPSQQNQPSQEETKAEKQSSNWLVYGLAGSLLSLLIIFLVSKRENSSINLTGKNNSSKDR